MPARQTVDFASTPRLPERKRAENAERKRAFHFLLLYKYGTATDGIKGRIAANITMVKFLLANHQLKDAAVRKLILKDGHHCPQRRHRARSGRRQMADRCSAKRVMSVCKKSAIRRQAKRRAKQAAAVAAGTYKGCPSCSRNPVTFSDPNSKCCYGCLSTSSNWKTKRLTIAAAVCKPGERYCL
jgi:hypothetical protein